MPAKEPEQLEDEELEVRVKEDEEEEVEEGEQPEAEQESEEEEKPKKDSKPSDSDDEDEDEESEQQKIEKRRKEKLERKERREKAIARDKLEMDFLRKRNEELEKRMLTQEMRAHRQDHYTVEQRIAEAEREARLAEEVMAKAIAEANGDDAAKALRYRDEALAKIRELSYERENLKKAEEQTKEPKFVADSVVNHYANEWISKNPWYDVNGRDEDSRIVLEIDSRLAKEGYVPRTELYWKELDKRVRRNLPHRFEHEQDLDYDEDDSISRQTNTSARQGKIRSYETDGENANADSRRPKKGPPLGAQREHAPASTRKEVYISKERKEALIAAGVWDDPVLRTKYVKQYQRWDKENATR